MDELFKICASGNKRELVEFLRRPEAIEYINIPFENGRTVLHYACSLGLFDIVKHLAKEGVDINVTDNDNKTPGQLAFSNGYGNIAEYLQGTLATKTTLSSLKLDVSQQNASPPQHSPGGTISSFIFGENPNFKMEFDPVASVETQKGKFFRTAPRNMSPFGIANYEDLTQIFIKMQHVQESSSTHSYTKQLQTLVEGILHHENAKTNCSPEVLIVIWLYLKLSWALIGASRDLNSDTKVLMKDFLMLAAANERLSYPSIKSQFDDTPHLLEYLADLLFIDDLLALSWSNSFKIQFPFWMLQYICVHLQKANKNKNIKVVALKKFIDNLLDQRNCSWVTPMLKSLPSNLASNIISSILGYSMTPKVELDLSKLKTLISLFDVKELGITWLKVLANSLRVEKLKMNHIEISSWIRTFWEISWMVCDETNIAEGVSCFIVPIMRNILAGTPQEIKHIFQIFQQKDSEIGKQIVANALEKYIQQSHIRPEVISRIGKEVVDMYELQPVVIRYIAMYANSNRDPTTGITTVLDALLEGYGIEVLAAIVSGDSSKSESELEQLMILIHIAIGCKRYDSHLTTRKESDFNRVKDILMTWINGPALSNILPQLEFLTGELESMQSGAHSTYSDMYCLILRSIAEVTVEQIMTSLGVEKQALQLQAVCNIPWINEARSDTASLLQIFISAYVIEIATGSFDQIALELPSNFHTYFRVNPVPISDQHEYALQLYSNTKTSFLRIFHDFLLDIFVEGQCTGLQLDMLQHSYSLLMEFAKNCQLSNLHQFDMHKLLGAFAIAHESAIEMQSVHEWIVSKNASVDFAPPVVHSNLYLRDLQTKVAEYKLHLELEEEVLAMLVCYVMKRSDLVAFVMTDFIPSSAQFKEISFLDLRQALNHAHNFVCKMFTDPGWSTQFFENPNILYMKPSLMSSNLYRMATFVKSTSPLDQQIVLLLQGFELSQYKHHLPLMLECFRFFHVSHSELTVLESWNTNISHISPTISQAPDLLSKIKKLVEGLSPLNMAYFQYARRAHQVVEFFSSQTDFQKKFDLISAKHQGHVYALSKLNNLFAVFEMLEPFNLFLKDQQNAQAHQHLSIASLCADLHRQFGVAENSSDRLKQILSVAEDFDELFSWFSQLGGLGLEAILPRISQMFQTGYFTSSCTTAHSQLKLVTKGETYKGKERHHEYAQAVLIDLVRGAKIFVDTNNAPYDQINHLSGFLACLELATKIHHQHSILKSFGHPNYQIDNLQIPYNGTMDVEKFDQQCEKMLCEEVEWSDNINRVYETSPRLLMLEKSQLSFFVQQLARPTHPANLIGYLWACFPDYEISVLQSLVMRKYDEFKTSLLTGNAAVLSCLQDAGKLTDVIDHDLRDTAKQIQHPRGLPELCLVTNQDEYFMFRLLFSLNGAPPHPSTLLMVSHSVVGIREIHSFAKKVEQFPHLKYFVIGVNSLLPEPRAALIKWISTLFVERTVCGQVYLIFTESAGVEAFSFLRCTKYTQSGEFSQPALNSQSIFKARNIAVFECLTGDHGLGKSFYIKSCMRAEGAQHTVLLSINEYFSVQTFLQEVQQHLHEAVTIGVHINVSAFAPFHLVSQFLYFFVVFGVIWDEVTGEMIPLPPNVKWLIFVEVGQASQTDPLFAHRNSTSYVLQAIPIVKHLATLVSLDTENSQKFPDSNYDAQVCYGFLLAFNKEIREVRRVDIKLAVAQKIGDILNILTIPAKLTCNWNVVHSMLKPKLDIPSACTGWCLFFSILKVQCEWMKEYAKFIYNTVDANVELNSTLSLVVNYTPPEHLFELFLREACFLSSKQLALGEVVFVCHSYKVNPPKYMLMNFGSLPCYDLPYISMQNAVKDPTILFEALSLTFGIDITCIANICTQKEYVLTPEFASTLFVVHTHITAGQNIILAGDTGTGKTELLSIYADLVNSYVPNLVQLFREQLVSLIIVNDLPRYGIQTWVQKDTAGRWELKAYDPEQILSCLEPIMNSVADEFREKLISGVGKFIQSQLLKYPLIIKEPDVLRSAVQPDVFVSDEEFKRLVSAFLTAKFNPVFYRIKMNNKLTTAIFKHKVNSIIEKTTDFMATGSKVVVFVDEFNATSIMGIIKEIFMDHTMDGAPLPPSLIWVGAMNPLRQTKSAPDLTKTAPDFNFTGVYAEVSDFIVRAHPPSMEALVLHIPDLSELQERNYLQVLLDSNSKIKEFGELGHDEKDSMLKWIIKAQNFVRTAQLHRMRVSIRDIMRTIQVYIFLRSVKAKRILSLVTLPPGESSYVARMMNQVLNRNKETENKYIAMYTHWIALIISIAMSYYFRLPSQQYLEEKSKLPSLRDQFANQCNELLKQHANPTSVPNFFNFEAVVTVLVKNFFDATAIPSGIAPTNSLKENLFCTVMCIEIKIPLIIIGPPGCAKTLSFSIAVDNMKGKQSQKPLYTNFHSVHVYRYQCSEHSTDAELREVYKNAIERQSTFAEQTSHRSVVLLDDAGLPNEINMPLKALHYHLDHPVVPTIILSNKMLDAAKTNRSLQLLQSHISFSDLRTLVIGCISKSLQLERGSEFTDSGIIDSLCTSYLGCNKFAGTARKEFFHLRDFVYFLRFLGLKSMRENKFELTGPVLLEGLQYHFSGILHEDFSKLVYDFFSKLPICGSPEAVMGHDNTFVEPIKRRLQENLYSRHIMVIDPTDNETAIELLFSHGICARECTQICNSTYFTRTTYDHSSGEIILQVKNAMESGETVVVINSQSILSSLYDDFDTITGPDGKLQRSNLPLCQQLCKVHENFKFILHVPLSSIGQVPSSVLSRFEKYLVGQATKKTSSTNKAVHTFSATQSPTLSRSISGTYKVLLIPSSQLEYNTDHELGLGAQGIAYRAKWKSRDVVFKKLHVRSQDSYEKREFLREMEVWRNVHHPNSISLYGAVDEPGKLGYVMEYCPNGNLHAHMKNGLVLGPTKLIDLACGISDIVSVLHCSAIAHRDIKSANIMLDRDFNPKLGDFGLSRILTTLQASATNFYGTPTHMAPEQFVTGAKHNPIQADIYSFGILLYELATNTVPFKEYNQFEIHQKVTNGERPPVQKDTPIGMEDYERKLWWNITTKCWMQDPLARPSMEEVSTMLLALRKTMFGRIQGFSCKEHKIGTHDYFLSYRVATEANTANNLYQLLSQEKCKSGEFVKVFLDSKCLPDAEDWQKGFLYGLHHTKIIVPIISIGGLSHFNKAHEENDNVLLEYEHMLSLLTLNKGQVKVFPLFVDSFPRASDYLDKPHISTGKNIRRTLEGILRLQGKKIESNSLEEVIPALLEKLVELDSGANTSLTLTVQPTTQLQEEEPTEVFVQIEGEASKDHFVEVSLSAPLSQLRLIISEQLDDFDFDYKFLKQSSKRLAVLSTKQESMKKVADIIDEDNNVMVRKVQ